MSTVNAVAIFHEYPFIARYVNRERADDACVQRFDVRVLGKFPYVYEWGGYCHLWFLDKDGRLIAKPRRRMELFWDFFKPECWGKTETIGDAFKRLDHQARRVHFVLEFSLEDEKRSSVLTFYKPPKGSPSIGEWFLSQVDQSRLDFEKEEQ